MIPPASPRAPFHVGISLHSFTEEYCALKWSFDDMMELASHLGRGVEIVGLAHHRGFPHVTPEFVRSFHSAVERHDLVPTSYGSYADPFMLTDRDLSDDELVDYTLPQLHTAAVLGFPVVRLQFFASRVVERILPAAEKLHLRLAGCGNSAKNVGFSWVGGRCRGDVLRFGLHEG